ncbi:hypothetical transposase [Shewanella benthica KT99]|uniref:Hypothetical transposase n=1 Tax=Shewanella benthica KT99 TaxID=314608 RepID=A9DCK5_9GAMM|nr:hypothetical transposase [Shewanella benthica KT99]
MKTPEASFFEWQRQFGSEIDCLNHLPLAKWFWAIYFLGSDKGSISALRLSKLIEVNWRTARLILSKLRTAMGHRDSLYRLSGLIEIDDAFVGGKEKR